MRCIIGLTLFAILYVSSCKVLYQGVATRTLHSGQGSSQQDAHLAGADALRKYHPLLALGAGGAAIVACSVPALLVKMNQRHTHWL